MQVIKDFIFITVALHLKARITYFNDNYERVSR
jgi:hypothetical protein